MHLCTEFGAIISTVILAIAIVGIIAATTKIAKTVEQSSSVPFFAGTCHRYLFFDLDDLFFCLFSFSIIITATPHNRSAKSLCCRNHVIPPAIAKIIPKIPIGCSRLTNVATPG
jgi:hypothetical protein